MTTQKWTKGQLADTGLSPGQAAMLPDDEVRESIELVDRTREVVENLATFLAAPPHERVCPHCGNPCSTEQRGPCLYAAPCGHQIMKNR